MSRNRNKRITKLEIQFRRTGERRYAVTVHRDGQSALEMNPAPGFDPLMPHDLLHYIVESELGLQHGIFGQLAEGGTAGTFHSTEAAANNVKEAARHRKREAKRGAKLLREGQDDSAQSELATNICLYEWLARSADAERRKLALHVTNSRNGFSATTLTENKLKQICARMDELSVRWAMLGVGEALTVTWPRSQ